MTDKRTQLRHNVEGWIPPCLEPCVNSRLAAWLAASGSATKHLALIQSAFQLLGPGVCDPSDHPPPNRVVSGEGLDLLRVV